MQDLLRQVSRSFFLTLRILPSSIRSQLSLAYLLARAADTVADTQLIDVPRRREALLQIRKCIQEACEGRTPPIPDFGQFSEAQTAIPAERVLLENFGTLLIQLRGFSAEDRAAIRKVLDTITHGQEMDLVRFGAASAEKIAALDSDEDLDAYTYDVAGCVGEFWTQICRAHIFPKASLQDDMFFTNAIRFGKGLQLVNILRDLPKDLRQGRCYVPRQELAKHGLISMDLLDANAIARFRSLYESYLRRTEENLFAGWQFTTALPFRCVRIRLACAWPILIGVKTMERLRRGNILDDRIRIKLSRFDVWRLMLRSIVLYPNRAAWNGLLTAPKIPHVGPGFSPDV